MGGCVSASVRRLSTMAKRARTCAHQKSSHRGFEGETTSMSRRSLTTSATRLDPPPPWPFGHLGTFGRSKSDSDKHLHLHPLPATGFILARSEGSLPPLFGGRGWQAGKLPPVDWRAELASSDGSGGPELRVRSQVAGRYEPVARPWHLMPRIPSQAALVKMPIFVHNDGGCRPLSWFVSGSHRVAHGSRMGCSFSSLPYKQNVLNKTKPLGRISSRVTGDSRPLASANIIVSKVIQS
jgi:hypothetical protein